MPHRCKYAVLALPPSLITFPVRRGHHSYPTSTSTVMSTTEPTNADLVEDDRMLRPWNDWKGGGTYICSTSLFLEPEAWRRRYKARHWREEEGQWQEIVQLKLPEVAVTSSSSQELSAVLPRVSPSVRSHRQLTTIHSRSLEGPFVVRQARAVKEDVIEGSQLTASTFETLAQAEMGRATHHWHVVPFLETASLITASSPWPATSLFSGWASGVYRVHVELDARGRWQRSGRLDDCGGFDAQFVESRELSGFEESYDGSGTAGGEGGIDSGEDKMTGRTSTKWHDGRVLWSQSSKQKRNSSGDVPPTAELLLDLNIDLVDDDWQKWRPRLKVAAGGRQ
ncbi:hypothetical protein C8F01DRAFT_1090679 [Mycena amicta]|nr:hypothetical protein C8F01DRAFT_1090679 [Mycena amicta]